MYVHVYCVVACALCMCMCTVYVYCVCVVCMTAQVYGTSLLTILFYTPLVCTYVQLWPASPVRESQKLKAWKQKKLMQSKRLALLSAPGIMPFSNLPVKLTCQTRQNYPSNFYPLYKLAHQTYPLFKLTRRTGQPNLHAEREPPHSQVPGGP